MFVPDDLYLYILGFLNTPIVKTLTSVLNPTVNLCVTDMLNIPFIVSESKKNQIEFLVSENLAFAKQDWDAFETSWGFVQHPIVKYANDLWDVTGIAATMSKYYGKSIQVSSPIELCYMLWQGEAVKRRVIPTNPCDQADRPKAVQYIGTYYNSAEIKQLLECLEGDPMKIAVILTAYYGLRRSEVLGLKWDAIDPVEDKIYIRHKIIENKLNGNEIEGLDVMKTKSSYRSLPLMPFIKKALEEEKARQEEMQRVLRKSYNRKYLDYVCVDAMGDILKPQYVTEHFKVILERNGLKKIRFHDLRHSCASLMLANDISMKEIQEWLGHSNISTTANIYAHVDSESKRESAKIIDKVLSSEEAV